MSGNLRRSSKLPTLARMPPLTSLRAFVVAARYLSFTRAAEELHVSSAAIGQQVRLLEEHLGQQLFVRSNRQMTLTTAGKALEPGLTDAFEAMLKSIARLSGGDEKATIRISVPPSFATKWLIPRLEGFRQAVPGVEIEVKATSEIADVERDETDCAIRFGRGAYPGLFVVTLFPEAVVPVCSPDFADDYDLGPRTRSLQGLPLLHEEGPEYDPDHSGWSSWLRSQGIPVRYSERGLKLNLSSMVLDAAVAGQGLALAKLRLAEADLRAGRLVAPLGKPQQLELAYHFVAAAHKARQPRIELLLDWLRRESAELRGGLAASAIPGVAGEFPEFSG